MAIFHKSPSYLKAKAVFNFFLGMLFILPAALYFYYFAEYQLQFDSFFLVPILLAAPANYYASQAAKFFSGAKGEAAAKKYLNKLPDNYHVFSNLPLEHDGQKCELDLLAIGNNGIFAVEVKNHKGLISGDADSEYWEQERTGKEGGIYIKRMKNPIKQVNRNVYILSRVLERNQLRSWITPLVLFSHQFSRVKAESNILHTSGESLVCEIQNTRARKPLNNDKIKQLKNLLIREAAKSQRSSFLSEVVFTKSTAIAVALFIVIIGIYAQLPIRDLFVLMD